MHGTCSGPPPAARSRPPGGATVSIDRGRSLLGRTAAPSVENAPSAGTDAISTSVGFQRVPRVHPLPRRGRALRNPCCDDARPGVRVTDRWAAPEKYDAVEAHVGRLPSPARPRPDQPPRGVRLLVTFLRADRSTGLRKCWTLCVDEEPSTVRVLPTGSGSSADLRAASPTLCPPRRCCASC